MTPEEKIEAIHQAVIEISANLRASASICTATHKTVDNRLDGLHKKIVGNGQPGLEQKHNTLEKRFEKLETKVIIWVSVVVSIGQLFLPKISKMMGLTP